jgi:hypothetical protein
MWPVHLAASQIIRQQVKAFSELYFYFRSKERHDREKELLYVAKDVQWRVVSDPDSFRLTWCMYFTVISGRYNTEWWASCVQHREEDCCLDGGVSTFLPNFDGSNPVVFNFLNDVGHSFTVRTQVKF